jgi:hypothetical protein
MLLNNISSNNAIMNVYNKKSKRAPSWATHFGIGLGTKPHLSRPVILAY